MSVEVDVNHPHTAKITATKELCASNYDRSCKHLEFDLNEREHLTYQTGDYVFGIPNLPY